MLAYWLGVLKKYEIEHVVMFEVPHNFYDYIIYFLAKKLGIGMTIYETTNLGDRSLVHYGDWSLGSGVESELQKLIGIDVQVDDLVEDVREYYLKQTDPKRDATPVYMKEYDKTYGGFNKYKIMLSAVVGSVRRGQFLEKFTHKIKEFLFGNLEREYKRASNPFDKNISSYVYAPLHFQPERTTSPLADVYTDQHLVIETLASSLPNGWKVIVKEHPAQWKRRSAKHYSPSRYRGYYEDIAKIPNVELVPINTNTYQLIENAKAVATCTGTAGIEAVMRGKPAFLFGSPWYRNCNQCFKISGVEDCKSAFSQIIDGMWKVNHSELLRFFKAFEKASYHAFSEAHIHKAKNSKLTPDESARAFAERVRRS